MRRSTRECGPYSPTSSYMRCTRRTTVPARRRSVWSSPSRSVLRCSAIGWPGGCGTSRGVVDELDARGQGGDPSAARQPPCDLRQTRAGTADGAPANPRTPWGCAMSAWACGLPASPAASSSDPAVPKHDLSAAAAVVPVHADLQSVRGRRAAGVRVVPGTLVGGGPAGQVRSVASWRMGPDTRDGADSRREPTEPPDAEERFACFSIGSAWTTSITRSRGSCGFGTRLFAFLLAPGYELLRVGAVGDVPGLHAARPPVQAVRPADPDHAADAGAAAADQGAAEEVRQGPPADGAGDAEAAEGTRLQPDPGLPADARAGAGVPRPVPRAASFNRTADAGSVSWGCRPKQNRVARATTSSVRTTSGTSWTRTCSVPRSARR